MKRDVGRALVSLLVCHLIMARFTYKNICMYIYIYLFIYSYSYMHAHVYMCVYIYIYAQAIIDPSSLPSPRLSMHRSLHQHTSQCLSMQSSISESFSSLILAVDILYHGRDIWALDFTCRRRDEDFQQPCMKRACSCT